MATHAPGRSEPSNPSIEVVHSAEESAENSSHDASQPNTGYEDVASRSNLTGSEETPQPCRAGAFNASRHCRLKSIKWRPLRGGCQFMRVTGYYRLAQLSRRLLGLWLRASSSSKASSLSDLMAFLPHELGGMAAGVVTPLALLWIVVAYFERSKIYEKEAFALRWHLNQLTFPSDDAQRSHCQNYRRAKRSGKSAHASFRRGFQPGTGSF